MWRHNFHVVWKTADKWQVVVWGDWQEVNGDKTLSHIFHMSWTTSNLNRSVWLTNQWRINKINGWMTNDSNFLTFPQYGGHHRNTGCGTGRRPQLRFDSRSLRQRGRSSQAVSCSINLVYLGPAWHPFPLVGLCRFVFIPVCDYELYKWWKATGRAGRARLKDRHDWFWENTPRHSWSDYSYLANCVYWFWGVECVVVIYQ